MSIIGIHVTVSLRWSIVGTRIHVKESVKWYLLGILV